MKPLDLSKIPTYDQLPVKAGAPKGASWGVFGENDQLGCLNFLTPENLAEAAKLVKRGKVFRLDSICDTAAVRTRRGAASGAEAGRCRPR